MDKRTGFVPNRFWLVATVVAVLSSVYGCLVSDPAGMLLDILLSLALTLPVALVLFRIGLFGGSDAKAMIMLSVFVPTLHPFFHPSEVPMTASLSATVNLVTLLATLLALNAIHNLLSRPENGSLMPKCKTRMGKILLVFGYKRAAMHHHQRGKKDNSRSGRHMDSEAIVVRNGRLVKLSSLGNLSLENHNTSRGIVELWVPLRIPLILIITIALLVSLLFGDLSSVFMI